MIGIEGAAPAAPGLPGFGQFHGCALTVHIADPCWLYAGQITEPGTGTTRLVAYRSMWLRPSDSLYQQLLDYLGDAVQVSAEIVRDPEMVFGSAELAIYERAAPRSCDLHHI